MERKGQKQKKDKQHYFNMETINNSVLVLLYEHRYIFSFLGALFEGGFIMILAGVLLKLGYFKFWGLITMLIGGYFLNGIGLYSIGRIGGSKILEKLSKHTRWGKRLLENLEKYSQKHSVKTIFLARITYGLGAPAFIIAGSTKMNFKKFLLTSFSGAIIWTLMLVAIGIIFGVGYNALTVVTKAVTFGLSALIFVGIIAISFLTVFWIRKFAETEFVENLSTHEESRILRFIGLTIKKIVKNK